MNWLRRQKLERERRAAIAAWMLSRPLVDHEAQVKLDQIESAMELPYSDRERFEDEMGIETVYPYKEAT